MAEWSAAKDDDGNGTVRDDAVELLTSMFSGKDNIESILRALTKPLEYDSATYGLEYVIEQLYTLLDIDNAEGAQLNKIGAIVREQRRSRTDSAYRAWIKARIAINISDGQADQVMRVVRLVLGDAGGHVLIPETFPPASYVLHVSGEALAYPWDATAPEDVAYELANAMREASSVGVKGQLHFQAADDDHTFTFASGDSIETDSDTGLGNDGGTTGGEFSDVA